VSDTTEALFSACELEFCNYGHIADQNIHLNVLAAVRTAPAARSPEQQEKGIERFAVTVPTSAEQRKYLKAAASGSVPASIYAYRAQYLTASATAAAGPIVCIERDSLAEFTSLVRAELNRHIFDLVLEVNGKVLPLLCLPAHPGAVCECAQQLAVLSPSLTSTLTGAFGPCVPAGSISAEHGVGAQKAGAMPWARSPAELRVMHAVKNALDPLHILNPGKVLPTEAVYSPER
jgi:hypothetical protein